jgi:hypothetical protein
MKVDSERREEYLRAYEAWLEQLAALHRVFLEGEAMDPPRLKGLLGRESRAKARYDEARLHLLGIGPPDNSPFEGV